MFWVIALQHWHAACGQPPLAVPLHCKILVEFERKLNQRKHFLMHVAVQLLPFHLCYKGKIVHTPTTPQ